MGRQIPSNFCGKRNISRSGVSRSARRQRWMKWCEVRMVRVPLTMWLTTNPDLLFSGNLHFRAYGRSQPCMIIYAQRTFPISQHLKFVWETWTSSQSRSLTSLLHKIWLWTANTKWLGAKQSKTQSVHVPGFVMWFLGLVVYLTPPN